MVFEENDGSCAEQVGVCDADVEIPQDAIRRMGMGFFRPIEEPLVADREGQCSTHIEPSSTHAQHVPTTGATSTPSPSTAEGQVVPESSRPDFPADTGLSSHPVAADHSAPVGEDINTSSRPDVPASPGLSGPLPV